MIETTHKEIRRGNHRVDKYVVYVIYDDYGKCAYVGSTRNLKNRFSCHSSQYAGGGVSRLFKNGPRDYRVEIWDVDEIFDIYGDEYNNKKEKEEKDQMLKILGEMSDEALASFWEGAIEMRRRWDETSKSIKEMYRKSWNEDLGKSRALGAEQILYELLRPYCNMRPPEWDIPIGKFR